MDTSIKNVFIAVRSIGERTEEACLQIVRSQIDSENQIYLVKNKPFPEAHIECIQAAVQSNAKWALFLDADVLLRKDAVWTMLSEAEKITDPFYMLNFRILDRGLNGEAYGAHLYSTEHFKEALQFKDIALQAQRPETQLQRELTKIGIPSLSAIIVVGLHGYEQFYSDLYRTTFVRAVKFREHQNYFLRLYQDRYFDENQEDKDFHFMFWGLLDGVIYGFDHEKVTLDHSLFLGKANRIFSLLQVQEKQPYFLDPEFIENTLDHYYLDELYLSNQKWICGIPVSNVPVPPQPPQKKKRQILPSIGRRFKKAISALIRG
jgi:hypothetical protein